MRAMPENDDPRLHIRLESDLKRSIDAAARLEGMSTSAWVREKLRDASTHIDVEQLTPAE